MDQMIRRRQGDINVEGMGEKEIEQEKREHSRETGPSLAKIKVKIEEDRLVNFGPYRMNTYGEALREDP